uniref:Glycerol-3-phosphate dehydrogenase n=3 Tax=Pseudo-nitzschia australis TaxID=44445 RepID=A0A7S4EQB9_9STRA|mmetsp:Transcript_7057/g.15954  ORF Transcript_7057/g.15954 Transcript_7057/m.15954 type:complete len:779 (+) Transcript_7057:319-2655(+)
MMSIVIKTGSVRTTVSSQTIVRVRRGSRSFFGGGQNSSSSSSRGKTNHQYSYRSLFSSARRDPGLEITSVLSDPKEVEGPTGLPSRAEQIRRLQQPINNGDSFDVLVIGGGATGAGIALDATMRGLQTACIERGDFASETSSRSTKLIWAGIKYMATATSILLSKQLLTSPVKTVKGFYLEMKMVFHCHQERQFMMDQQRHLCNWVPIAMPFTEWHVSPPPFKHPLFSFFPILAPPVLKIYDSLSYFQCPPSFIMTKKKAREIFPQLEDKDLKYCAVFYEAQHNDARTNIAIAMTAAEKGAAITNYVEMINTIKDPSTGKVIGVHAIDRMTGNSFEIRAKRVIFAGGPFTDSMREMEVDTEEAREKMPAAVRGASGTHIVLPGYYCPNEMGLLDYNTSDGRFLFMLPWEGHTLVGTTDTKGPAETSPRPPEDEIDWLLKECGKYLTPDMKLRRSDVLSAWRGWRPLAADPHAPPGAPVSRDHIISENPDTGVIFIAGGKWTTWREMAEEVVDRIAENSKERCKTLETKLFGGEGYTKNLSIELIQKYGMSQDVAEHLVKSYGARSWEVCALIEPSGKNWPKFGRLLVDNYPYIDADVVWACREYACTIEDVLSRRTRLAFLNKDAALEAIPVIADIMAKELGWTSKVKKQQIEAAEMYVNSYGGRISDTCQDKLKAGIYKNIQDVFVAIDSNDNGFLEENEVKEVAAILGFGMSAKDLEKAFHDMDRGKKGRVSIQDFIDWWTKSSNSPFRKKLSEELGLKALSLEDLTNIGPGTMFG